MPIPVTCSGCQRTMKVKDEFAGTTAQCPFCQNAVAVPPRQTEEDRFPGLPDKAVRTEPSPPDESAREIGSRLQRVDPMDEDHLPPIRQSAPSRDPPWALFLGGIGLLVFSFILVSMGGIGLYQGELQAIIAFLIGPLPFVLGVFTLRKGWRRRQEQLKGEFDPGRDEALRRKFRAAENAKYGDAPVPRKQISKKERLIGGVMAMVASVLGSLLAWLGEGSRQDRDAVVPVLVLVALFVFGLVLTLNTLLRRE